MGGFTLKPPKQFLFTDLRHIETGDLEWLAPDGQKLPVAGPPEPAVEARAALGMTPYGIRLVAQRCQKEGPLEQGSPDNVIYDQGAYRAWYLRVRYPEGKDLGSYSVVAPDALIIVYAESNDGYAWDYREMGHVEIAGMTGIDGGTFFIDPKGPANERYKCVFNARLLEDDPLCPELWKRYLEMHPAHRDDRLGGPHDIDCLWGMVSPDGLHWEMIKETLLINKGDTDNTVYYDDFLDKYVLYTRLYWLRRRMVARAESDDFRHWSPIQPVIWPNLFEPVTNDIYTNARTCYAGLPEHHLMFPMFYKRYTQTSECRMFSSIDGLCWNEVPGGAVYTPGGTGWNGVFGSLRKNLIPLGNDRVALGFGEGPHPHKYPRWQHVLRGGQSGYAVWPKGRLCALTADREGAFYTFPIDVTGRELRINADIHRAGELRVGLADPAGKPIEGRTVDECHPMFGDSSAHVVAWHGDANTRQEPGAKVRVHFKLRAAKLFGFEWV